jgi:hypothetical protein
MGKAICPDEPGQISRKPHRSKSSDKDYASIKKGGKQFRRSFKTFHFWPRIEHGFGGVGAAGGGHVSAAAGPPFANPPSPRLRRDRGYGGQAATPPRTAARPDRGQCQDAPQPLTGALMFLKSGVSGCLKRAGHDRFKANSLSTLAYFLSRDIRPGTLLCFS